MNTTTINRYATSLNSLPFTNMRLPTARSTAKANRLCQLLYWINLFLAIVAASFVSGFLSSSFSSSPRQRQRHSTTKIRNTAVCFGRKTIVVRSSKLQLSPFNETNYFPDDDILSRRQTLVRAISFSTATLFSIPSIAISDDETINNDDDTTIQTTTNQITTTKALQEPNSFEESLSGFVAGAALVGTKTIVKFPLDTATVRVQMPNSNYSVRDPSGLFNGCYNGFFLTLLSNIPAGAVFFAVKDSVKTSLKNSGSPGWLTTSLAVAAAQIPYWIVRNPSEVVKVRQQANIEGYGEGVSAFDAVRLTLKSNDDENRTINDGLSEFYTGYWENIIYAYPADVIKFVAYESITKGRKDLSPVEGAKAGAIATSIAQLLTTPLDVVRNRLMTGKNGNGLSLSEKEKNKGYVESLITLGKEEGLKGLFAGGIPRVGKSILSGAIQFATYEETKQSITKFLIQR
jgi:solute carrier family 25 S-adenosylmethionine transporter 26